MHVLLCCCQVPNRQGVHGIHGIRGNRSTSTEFQRKFQVSESCAGEEEDETDRLFILQDLSSSSLTHFGKATICIA